MSKENQHYVPQSYLKRFSDNDRNVWTYNITNDTISHPNTTGICAENNFYIPKAEFIPQGCGQTLSYIEKDYWSELENGRLLDLYALFDEIYTNYYLISPSVIGTVDFNEDYRRKISDIIITQFFRLPRNRNQFCDRIASENKFLNEILAPHGIQIKTEFDPVLHHAQATYNNQDRIDSISTKLCSDFWVIFLSKNNSFYTSDNPVVVYNPFGNNKYIDSDIGDRFTSIFYPISSSICLCIYDKEYCDIYKKWDNCIAEIDDDNLTKLNINQYKNASRFVISRHNDFKIITQYINGKTTNEKP